MKEIRMRVTVSPGGSYARLWRGGNYINLCHPRVKALKNKQFIVREAQPNERPKKGEILFWLGNVDADARIGALSFNKMPLSILAQKGTSDHEAIRLSYFVHDVFRDMMPKAGEQGRLIAKVEE